jgi:hypothetical protein
VRTGREGGFHRYLNHPGGTIGNARLGPGVDVRADKGYVLAPPSVHPSGGIYKWENELVPIRSLTEHELTIIVRAQSGREQTQVASMEQITEGNRHSFLVSYTGRLLAKGLSEDEVSVLVHRVVAAKCEGGEEGMEPREVDAIVHDIAEADRSKSVRGGRASSSEPKVFNELLAVLASANAELWHTKDRQAYSSMTISGHPDHLPVKSKAFKQFLLHGFAQVRGKPAPSDAVESTIALFEARAIHDGPEHTIHTRIAREADVIYLDLANPEREVVRIDATGWEIVTNAPVRFQRSATMRPLPRPVGPLSHRIVHRGGGTITNCQGPEALYR